MTVMCNNDDDKIDDDGGGDDDDGDGDDDDDNGVHWCTHGNFIGENPRFQTIPRANEKGNDEADTNRQAKNAQPR